MTHSNLALAYANIGEFDKAKSSLEQATVLGYKQPDVIQAKIDNLKLAAIEKGPDAASEKGPDAASEPSKN